MYQLYILRGKFFPPCVGPQYRWPLLQNKDSYTICQTFLGSALCNSRGYSTISIVQMEGGGGDNSGHTEAPVPYYKWHNGGELTSPCYCVGLGMSQDRRHSSLVLLRVGLHLVRVL
jgi:hypothetical protein